MDLVGVVRWREGLVAGVVVYIDCPVKFLGGRVVSGVGWDCADISGGVGDLGTIRRVVLILREAAMAGLAGCLFRGDGCGWWNLPIGGGIEGGGVCIGYRVGIF